MLTFCSCSSIVRLSGLVAVLYMANQFLSIINQNTVIPVLLAERSVFYRESYSLMYPVSVLWIG